MTAAIRLSLVAAFRRAALPLAWYYAVTLALPLANGAAQSGAAFVHHALVVLVLPPILIVLVGALHSLARVFVTTCRSTLPLYPRRILAGDSSFLCRPFRGHKCEEVAGERPLRT